MSPLITCQNTGHLTGLLYLLYYHDPEPRETSLWHTKSFHRGEKAQRDTLIAPRVLAVYGEGSRGGS
eukprot:7162214-Prymnesium_polylepis.1